LQGKFKDILIKVVLHPLIIAIPFALITILLLPPIFTKSSFNLISFRPADKKGKTTVQHYYDLDGDGIDEEISHFRNLINQCAIKVICGDGRIAGQWNLNGILPPGACNLLYLDFDNDGSKEVLCLYQREDSVFMAGIDHRIDSMLVIEELFVDKIHVVNGSTDFSARLYCFDLDQDGSMEAIVIISAGYSKQPRKIYTFNFVTKEKRKSPAVGFRIESIEICDLDNDGKAEMVTTTSSPENIKKSVGIPYSDFERWFVIYDDTLGFDFGPIKMGDGAGGVYPFVFRQNDSLSLIVYDYSSKSNNPNLVYQYDFGTKKLKPIDLTVELSMGLSVFRYQETNQEALAAYDAEQGKIFLLDPFKELEVKKVISIEKNLKFRKSIDILNQSNKGYIFQRFNDSENQLLFYSSGFKLLYHYTLPRKYADFRRIAIRNLSDDKKHLVLQMDEDILELAYVTDNWYYIKNTAHDLIIYGIYALIIFLITMAQKRLLRNHYKREQALTELKLVSIRNQMDPHFTFNAINAIAAAIYKEDKETAYNYFSIFSKLIRSTMLYSDRMTRSLDEEIDFTVKYLKIEKFRFRDKFNYKLDIEDEVNLSVEVPRMVIQTYAESAVTNGLMNRLENGLLHIRIRKEDENIVAIFDDNGVGMEECKRLNKEKAFKSAKIMEEFIRLFNDLNNTNVTCEMKDLDLTSDYPGTRVTVKIPLKKYRIRS